MKTATGILVICMAAGPLLAQTTQPANEQVDELTQLRADVKLLRAQAKAQAAQIEALKAEQKEWKRLQEQLQAQAIEIDKLTAQLAQAKLPTTNPTTQPAQKSLLVKAPAGQVATLTLHSILTPFAIDNPNSNDVAKMFSNLLTFTTQDYSVDANSVPALYKKLTGQEKADATLLHVLNAIQAAGWELIGDEKKEEIHPAFISTWTFKSKGN